MTADDPYAKTEEEERREIEREQDLERMRELLRLSQFQWFILRFLQSCDIFSHGYVGSAEVHYKAGRKSAGMDVFNQIRNADPKAAADLVVRMTKTDD